MNSLRSGQRLGAALLSPGSFTRLASLTVGRRVRFGAVLLGGLLLFSGIATADPLKTAPPKTASPKAASQTVLSPTTARTLAQAATRAVAAQEEAERARDSAVFDENNDVDGPEEDLFGAEDDKTEVEEPRAGTLGDERMRQAVVERRDLLDEDRLQLGGLFYMQSGLFLSEDEAWEHQPFTYMNLTDVYMDARPNDRVRAFIRGRMLYSPVEGSGMSSAFLGTSTQHEPVRMLLDQLWLKFDIERRVYLTVGAQHLRWGATRLWNPVDVIYATRRNPLTLFDQRTGLPMLKLHVPFEVAGSAWNAYAIALADDASDLAHFGVAARLEAVVSTWEIGLTAMRRRQRDPRLGLDVSAGVWLLDLTGELGLRLGDDAVDWMASGGLSYTLNYGDDDSVILGVEVFHNPGGYPTAAKAARGMADITISQFLYGDRSSVADKSALDFFYMGQDYAALFAVAMGPGSWDDTSFTFSVVSNLSDRTGVARLDVGTSVLTHLRLEIYASAFFGSDGEFRFYGESLPKAMGEAMPAALAKLRPADLTDEAKKMMAKPADAQQLAVPDMPTPMGQLGLNLRVSL